MEFQQSEHLRQNIHIELNKRQSFVFISQMKVKACGLHLNF